MDVFTNVPTAGKIAMRFGTDEEGDASDRLIGVSLLTEEDDVLLATRHGRAVRFAATDVREFQSRTAAGVRGIRLRDDDEVISLSILKGFSASTDERDAYLRAAPWKENENEATLSPERMAEFAAAEEFILTVTENGYGKRTSAFEYRRTNRGGQGITNIETSKRNGCVVASFPAHNGQQLMLVTERPWATSASRDATPRASPSSASPRTSMSSPPPGSRRARTKRKRSSTWRIRPWPRAKR
jgi:DNA gyrase subunit A